MELTYIALITGVQVGTGLLMAGIKTLLIHIALERYTSSLKLKKTRSYNAFIGYYDDYEATNRPEAKRKTRRAIFVVRVINAFIWLIITLCFLGGLYLFKSMGAKDTSSIAALLFIPMVMAHILGDFALRKVTGQADEIRYIKS